MDKYEILRKSAIRTEFPSGEHVAKMYFNGFHINYFHNTGNVYIIKNHKIKAWIDKGLRINIL